MNVLKQKQNICLLGPQNYSFNNFPCRSFDCVKYLVTKILFSFYSGEKRQTTPRQSSLPFPREAEGCKPFVALLESETKVVNIKAASFQPLFSGIV